jgi:hypothetical protein
MKINPQLKRNILIVMISILAISSLLAVLPTPAAYAGDNEPTYPVIPGLGRVPNPTLSHMLVRLRAWHASQTTIFRDANKLAEDFQSLITVQSLKKKNVAELEAALVTFNDEMAVAQTVYTNAGKVLVANAGFNPSFNVTDRQAAGRTFLDAREYLRDSHFRVLTAMDNLTRVYKHFRGTYINNNQ